LEEEIEEVDIQNGDVPVAAVEVIVEASAIETSEVEELDGDTEV
jgi:hypothetical protein